MSEQTYDDTVVGDSVVGCADLNAFGKRLACFPMEAPGIALLGRETIYQAGERMG